MNFLLKTLTRLFIVCLLQLIFVSFVFACMCPSGNSVRSEFDRSANVIRAKLEPFEITKANIEENVSGERLPLDISSMIKKSLPKLTVQEVLKGNLQVGEILDFDGVFRCSLIFAGDGEEYLLYLGDRPKQGKLWQIPGCSKSGLIENRRADLLYIGQENKVRNKTRIAGRLFHDKSAIAAKDKSQLPVLANRKVYFIGESSVFEANTDKNGVYEIYDLPPGTYQVSPENIPGWISKVYGHDSGIVEIAKSGQYERDFNYKIESSMSKEVFEVSELSAKTCLELKPIANGTKKIKE